MQTLNLKQGFWIELEFDNKIVYDMVYKSLLGTLELRQDPDNLKLIVAIKNKDELKILANSI